MPPADATTGTAETLVGMVEHHVQHRPDGIAIRFGERQWSWAQWAARIQQAAGALRAAGLQRGQCVAFLDKNHPACLETLLAAASLGAVATIVNWRVIGDELVHVLNDSGARVLFVGEELQSAVEAIRTKVPGLDRVIVVGGDGDEYESLLEAATPVTTDPEVSDNDTALTIYSSGTTGRPKGVQLTQRALVNHIVNLSPPFPFEEGDANLVAMPLFHVGGIAYAFFGIRAGVPTFLTREPEAATLIGAVKAGATHAFFVPPVIARFLEAGEAATNAIAGLRYLVYGAAPMPLPLLQQRAGRLAGHELRAGVRTDRAVWRHRVAGRRGPSRFQPARAAVVSRKSRPGQRDPHRRSQNRETRCPTGKPVKSGCAAISG